MTDAPEHIWAGVLTDEYRGMTGTRIRVWGDDPRVGTDDPAIEYVRADLVEALEAENQRLRATLSAITATDCYSRDECTAMARAALRSTEASHDD